MLAVVNTRTFPDQGHIDRIRQLLWVGREFGQAAVMVGAGFSRNAQRISANAPALPSWNELAEQMYDTLYSSTREPSDGSRLQKARSTSGVGALRLAYEFEKAFGKPALETFLMQAIAEMNYVPGRLHSLLLSLPWSDVFTTNYDTLLERTLPSIHDRKYDVIRTASDLPGAMRPRIVKLHGSFPSHRPFIVTEEEYRTYPREFAAFVNMVQQSIMENVFCLIGFSGDDPNFLYWTGWVRDNLGPASPLIYLCGLLDLSNSQRLVLQSRNVVPIDLSPLFPEHNWPDSALRHAKAVEWFLGSLKAGQPPNVMTWPTFTKPDHCKLSDDLPEIYTDPMPKAEPHFEFRRLEPHDFEELCEAWRTTRLQYPGWLVAPKENREELWRNTQDWVAPVLGAVETISTPGNLFLLFELNWRLETTLTPLLGDWSIKIQSAITMFNPSPSLIELEGAAVRPDNDEYRHLEWVRVRDCWVALVFALIRDAREKQDESGFRLWMDRLKDSVKQSSEWHARWSYEECLFSLFRLDQEKTREALEKWSPNSNLPFWEVKRAAIFAELGALREAEAIAESALAAIRSRLKPYAIDYLYLSQEGWAMILLQNVRNARRFFAEDLSGQYRDRWTTLGAYDCDPWRELGLLGAALEGPRPASPPEREVRISFDPGYVHVTHHARLTHDISAFRPAFALLRIFDEGALPMHIDNVGLLSDTVLRAARWIARLAPTWSVSSLVRAGNDNEVKTWFDRIAIATLNPAEVDHLFDLFTNALAQAVRTLSGGLSEEGALSLSFSERITRLVPELLSQLSFRLSKNQRKQLLRATMELYGHSAFRRYPMFPSGVKSLFLRLLFAMPESEILDRMPELLALPIPTETGFDVTSPDLWLEPFDHIHLSSSLAAEFDRSLWSGPIANLIRIVRDGSEEARWRATLRLIKVNDISALTEGETEALTNALWSRTNSVSGLPEVHQLYDFAFLYLPEPEPGRAKSLFRRHLLSSGFPKMVQRNNGGLSMPLSAARDPYVQNWLNGTLPLFPRTEDEQKLVDWAPDEAIQLLEKAVEWWNQEKEGLSKLPRGGLFDTAEILRTALSQLMPLMVQVVMPRLREEDENSRVIAKTLISEMKEQGFYVLQAIPLTLFIDPRSFDEAAGSLRSGLNSTSSEEVEDSIAGLLHWLVFGDRGKVHPPPSDLIDELISMAISGRHPGLAKVLGGLTDVVHRLPHILTAHQLQKLCVALEYLKNRTELPPAEERESLTLSPQTIPIGELPRTREIAAKLAKTLMMEFTNRDVSVPQILVDWKDISCNDPLPEVRRAFEPTL